MRVFARHTNACMQPRGRLAIAARWRQSLEVHKDSKQKQPDPHAARMHREQKPRVASRAAAKSMLPVHLQQEQGVRTSLPPIVATQRDRGLVGLSPKHERQASASPATDRSSTCLDITLLCLTGRLRYTVLHDDCCSPNNNNAYSCNSYTQCTLDSPNIAQTLEL